MIALRLLGPVDLREPSGRVLRATLGQPKRLALLAYLAAAKPTGFHSRDMLLALLWPDSDREHARAALRQAVYFLRQSLGDDVFIGCGDSSIGIETAKLWCDVNAFEDAIASGEDAHALEFYRGPLLEGFHVGGGLDFERWIDRERVRLAASAAGAASRLAAAEEERGNATRALHWTRRLLAIRPDDECALRHTIRLLHHVGDRAAAVRAYDEFKRRIELDYGLEPSAHTRALIAAVRSEALAG